MTKSRVVPAIVPASPTTVNFLLVYCDESALVRNLELLGAGISLLHEDVPAFFHELFRLFGKFVVVFFFEDLFQVFHSNIDVELRLNAELSNVKVRTAYKICILFFGDSFFE